MTGNGWSVGGVVTKHVLYGLRVDRGEAVAGVLARELGHDFEQRGRATGWVSIGWLGSALRR